MALSQAQKDALIVGALRSRKTSVDDLLIERRSVSEMRDIIELVSELDGSSSPDNRIHMTSLIPPGALDGVTSG